MPPPQPAQAPSHPGLSSILITGAGPSGLLLALLLTTLTPRPEITILDAAPSLNTAPRATHYGPPAVSVLRRAGILHTVRTRGYQPETICWRKLDGTRLAGLDRGLLHDGGIDGNGLTVLSVGELGQVMVEELGRRGVGVRWGEKVVGVGGQEDGAQVAWVDVEIAAEGNKKKRYEADFVVGCDGGASAVRRLLFGKGGFGGFTWGEQIVATNTYYDGFAKAGWEDTNFIIHPEHWYMAARISRAGLWRVSYGEIPGLSDAELLARQPMKFEQMLPGHPKPDEYKIENISPYKVHQRCVERMAVGRVALAADAAHLCNPFGGLGLTGGIVDIEGLFDCLAGIHANAASPSILDKYSEIRVQRWHDVVNPISTANLRRMAQTDPETVMEKDEFLQVCKRAETDVELSKELQNSGMVLRYDFTQHWDGKKATNGEGGGEVMQKESVGQVDEKTAVSIVVESTN